MQVLRDHELVLSCTRNLVLVFSIAILFTTQDVSGESILSQSWEKETWWHNQRFPSQGGLFDEKTISIIRFTIHCYWFLHISFKIRVFKNGKYPCFWFLSVFFIGSCYICQCIGLHLRPISHIFLSFILIHLSHFIKFYLLFTNLKFKEKILVFLFRRFTLLQFRIIVDSF